MNKIDSSSYIFDRQANIVNNDGVHTWIKNKTGSFGIRTSLKKMKSLFGNESWSRPNLNDDVDSTMWFLEHNGLQYAFYITSNHKNEEDEGVVDIFMKNRSLVIEKTEAIIELLEEFSSMLDEMMICPVCKGVGHIYPQKEGGCLVCKGEKQILKSRCKVLNKIKNDLTKKMAEAGILPY